MFPSFFAHFFQWVVLIYPSRPTWRWMTRFRVHRIQRWASFVAPKIYLFMSSVEVDDSFILRLCHDIFSMGFMAINLRCAPLSGHTHILILGETYPIHTTPKKTVAFLTPSRFRAPILLGMNPQGLSHNIQLGMRLDAILWLFFQMVIKHKLYTHARIFWWLKPCFWQWIHSLWLFLPQVVAQAAREALADLLLWVPGTGWLAETKPGRNGT